MCMNQRVLRLFKPDVYTLFQMFCLYTPQCMRAAAAQYVQCILKDRERKTGQFIVHTCLLVDSLLYFFSPLIID